MRRALPALLCLCLCLGLLAAALPARAEQPATGFLWNRSGLPATLPLLVRAPTGMDHVVFLTRPDADAPAVAGYVRGGEMLRLRVPPGDWRISLASGRDWQGEEALFGAGTQRSEWPAPLHFSAGAAELHGHAIDLAEEAGTIAIAGVAPQVVCQLPAASRAPNVRPLQGGTLTRYDPLLRRDRTSWSNPQLRRDNMDRLNFARPEQRPDDRLAGRESPGPGALTLPGRTLPAEPCE